MSINNIVDDLEQLATKVLFQTGAVYACPIHDEVILTADDKDAEQKAYEIATNILKDEWGGLEWREDPMEEIKNQIDQANYDCPHCEANFRD